MEVLNYKTSRSFDDAGGTICMGFVTGPMRMIMAITQIVMNILGLFLSLPLTLCGCVQTQSAFHARALGYDGLVGCAELVRGFVETLPGTSGDLHAWVFDCWKPNKTPRPYLCGDTGDN